MYNNPNNKSYLFEFKINDGDNKKIQDFLSKDINESLINS